VIGPEEIEEFDYIATYEGDDIVRFDVEHVQVCAGKGNDQVIALPGANYTTIFGAAGKDRLGALEGHVTGQINVYAGGGSNYVVGGGDNDDLYGGLGPGDDEIFGMGGRDDIGGGGGRDVAFGGSGSDRVYGDDGNDVLKGNKGDQDTTWGGDGEDGCQAEFRHQCEHY
jgi:Ca2+-binding RTX toxin-like protein